MLSISVSAQWYQQYSEPQGYFLDIDFTSVDVGWVAGLWKMMRTTDGGNNWFTLIDRPQSNTVIRRISFVNNTIGWYTENVGDENHNTIYKTTNGGDDWILQYTSPQFTSIWDLEFIDQNSGFGVGSDPTFPILFKTTNAGNSWSILSIDNVYAPTITTLFFLDALHGWVAGDAIYKTTDGGYTWDMLVGPYWEDVIDIQFITPSIGWFTDRLGIEKTTDGGFTWIQQATGGDGWHQSSLYFIDSDTGYFCPFNKVLKTTNGGSSWVSQLEGTTLNLSDVCFVNPSHGWLLGYTPGRIFHTENGGTPVELISFGAEFFEGKVELNWSTATETNNSGFEILKKELEVRSKESEWEKIGFVPGHGTTTETQHYSFTDSDVKPGKYQYKLKQIDYDGTFEYSQIVEVEIPFANKFSLSQNYPNPFNPSTKIKYEIPASLNPSKGGTLVQLVLYDILGREVTVLVNEEKQAGEYEVEFNGAKLPSGVYFYQLKASEFTQTKKMILLK
jgi:photosystem II stability/assembly factor-like uncharacterized protein